MENFLQTRKKEIQKATNAEIIFTEAFDILTDFLHFFVKKAGRDFD